MSNDIEKIANSSLQPTEQIDKINEMIDKAVFRKVVGNPTLYAWKQTYSTYYMFYTKSVTPAINDYAYDRNGNYFDVPNSGKTVQVSRVRGVGSNYIGVIIHYTDSSHLSLDFFYRVEEYDLPQKLIDYKGDDLRLGTLHIDSTYGIINNGNYEGFTQNVQEIDLSTLPSESKYAGLQINDVNHTRISKLEANYQTNGSLYTSVSTKKRGENSYASIQVGYDSNGNFKAKISTSPDMSDVSESIATTRYVHKQVQGGKIACNANKATWVAFPYTFPSDNVAIAIVRKASDTATGGTYVPFVRQHYSSGFNLYNPASGEQTVFWIATWLG